MIMGTANLPSGIGGADQNPHAPGMLPVSLTGQAALLEVFLKQYGVDSEISWIQGLLKGEGCTPDGSHSSNEPSA
jgi:hypothetical protein